MFPLLSSLVGCFTLDKVPVFSSARCAPDRYVEVGCVLDGDTFQVGTCGGESVRLLGVDAPEIAHNSSETDMCFGPEARDWTTDQLLGRTVRLEFDLTCEDMYGRTLAYVYLVDAQTVIGDTGSPVDVETEETFINAEILREGRARVYEDFDDILLKEVLYTAQATGQRNNAGLWAECE
jgi:micrococcal nuclease